MATVSFRGSIYGQTAPPAPQTTTSVSWGGTCPDGTKIGPIAGTMPPDWKERYCARTETKLAFMPLPAMTTQPPGPGPRLAYIPLPPAAVVQQQQQAMAARRWRLAVAAALLAGGGYVVYRLVRKATS